MILFTNFDTHNFLGKTQGRRFSIYGFVCWKGAARNVLTNLRVLWIKSNFGHVSGVCHQELSEEEAPTVKQVEHLNVDIYKCVGCDRFYKAFFWQLLWKLRRFQLNFILRIRLRFDKALNSDIYIHINVCERLYDWRIRLGGEAYQTQTHTQAVENMYKYIFI